MAEAYAEQMKRPDLRFMTQENQSQVLAEVAEQRATCAHEWDDSAVRTVCKLCMIGRTEWDAAVAAMPKGVPCEKT